MRINPIVYLLRFAVIPILCSCSPEIGNPEATPVPVTSSTVFTNRVYYHAPLEIPDKVLHGAGQGDSAFRNYFHVMRTGTRPVVYSAHLDLKDLMAPFFSDLVRVLRYYSDVYDVYLVPRIGLSMTTDGEPGSHYEDDVAKGRCNDEINELCKGISGLGHPVLLSIGPGCNNLTGNGYIPAAYKQAFAAIADGLRGYKLEAATVWSVTLPLDNGANGYADYYPGDGYVDWWSVDLFLPADLTGSDTGAFLAAAQSHNKPVIIGGSTPGKVGVTDGQSDWSSWFEPYFALIQAQPGIKAFCYIDWNWADYPRSENWGDARIEMNSQVSSNFVFKLESPLYLHGSGEAVFRKAMGSNDTTPPGKVNGVKGLFDGYAVNLHWNPSTDNTSIIRYEISAGESVVGNSIGTDFRDANLRSGEKRSYTVRAVDSGANRGESSGPIEVEIPEPLGKIVNGEFDNGTTGWETRVYDDSSIRFDIDGSSKIEGQNSAKLVAATGSGKARYVQLVQVFYSHPGKTYSLVFSAVADSPSQIDIVLEQTHAPFDSILAKTVNIESSVKTYSFVNSKASAEDALVLAFMLGTANGRTVWLDKIRLMESD